VIKSFTEDYYRVSQKFENRYQEETNVNLSNRLISNEDSSLSLLISLVYGMKNPLVQ